jgi:acetyltransferase
VKIVLDDGRELLLRPLRAGDFASYCELVDDMDPEDVRMRFFAPLRHLPPEMAHRLTEFDPKQEYAIAAVGAAPDGHEQIYGVAHLMHDSTGDAAEFAILVRSDIKGHGLGTIMMQHVLDEARRRGLARVYGDVLRENQRMLTLAQDLGFVVERHPGEPHAVRVVLPL